MEDDYKTTGNLGALHGGNYQVHASMLIYERACNSKRYVDMQLAMEMDAAEKFDDCVISWHDQERNSKNWLFVQVKRKEGQANIRKDAFLPTQGKEKLNGDFSLFKYVQSGLNIHLKKQFEGTKKYFIFTNVGIFGDLEPYLEPAEEEEIEKCIKVEHPRARWLKVKKTDEILKLLDGFINLEFNNLVNNIRTVMIENQIEFEGELIQKYRADLADKILVAENNLVTFAPRFVEGFDLDPLETSIREQLLEGETHNTLNHKASNNEKLYEIIKNDQKKSTPTTLPRKFSQKDIELFLEKFILAVGQPDNKVLQDIIKKDLGRFRRSEGAEMKNYYEMLAFQSLQELVYSCFEKTRRGKLLKKSDLETKMKQTNESFSKWTQLYRVAAKFPEALENLAVKFTDLELTETTFPLRVMTSTPDGLLTRLKYFGKLQRHRHSCFHMKDLIAESVRNDLFSMLESEKEEHFIMINVEDSKNDHLDEIVTKIKNLPSKKLIVLTNSKDSVVSSIIHVIEDEKSDWQSLDESSQKKLMERNILFQNDQVKLSELIDQDPGFDRLLQGEILEHLVQDKTPLRVGHELPRLSEKHYLLRTIIVLQSENCKRLTEFGESSFIEYVSAADKPKVIVLLSPPGNGKSTLWTSLALKIKAQFPSHWVLYLKPQDFVDCTSDVFDVKSIFKLNEFEEAHMQLCRQSSKSKVFVLFDGFDEVPYGISKQVLKFMKELSQSTRILINTRDYREEDLREAFPDRELIGLEQFDETDQKTMLAALLKVEEYISIDPLKSFMELILEKLYKLRGVNKFLGVPLMIEMLSTIYRTPVEEYLNSRKEEMLQQNQLTSLSFLELYEEFVYNAFRRKAISQLGLQEGSKHAKEVLSRDNNLYQDFLDLHYKLGIMNLIGEQSMKIFFPDGYSLKQQQQRIKNIDSAVVLNISNALPRFIHKSFEEFFVARFLSEYLKNMDRTLVEKKFPTEENMLSKYQLKSSKTIVTLFDAYYSSLYRYPTVRKFFMTIADSFQADELDNLIRMLMSMQPDSFLRACEENCLKLVDTMIRKDPSVLKSKTITNETPLHRAAARGNLDICKILFENECALNALDKWGQTPLHKASLNGHVQAVEFLLDQEADIDCRDSKNQSAVYLAACEGYAEVVELLASKGAYLDNLDEIQWYKWYELYEFHKNALYIAAIRGHEKVVRVLLEHNAQLKNSFIDNMLHDPFYHVDNDIVCLFIDHKMKTDRESAKDMLEWIVEYNKKRLFETAVAHLDHSKLNELYKLACKHRSYHIARLIISLAEPFSSLENALHLAVKMADEECVRAIIERNPEVDSRDSKGRTPLQYALESAYTNTSNSLKCMKILMDGGTDINVRDNFDQNLLLLAVKNNFSSPFVQLFLDYGVDPSIPNADGKTALHLVVENRDVKTLELILKHTKNFPGFMNHQDKNGNTALHEALKLSLEAKKHSRLIILRNAEILLEHGINPYIANKTGKTALHLAVMCKNKLKILEQILKSALNNTELINETDIDGRTALHTLLRSKTHEKLKLMSMKLLLEYGMKPSLEDKDGETALHLAVECNDPIMVQLVLDHSESLTSILNHKNKMGRTALHLTCIEGKEADRCIKILVGNGADPNIRDHQGQTVLHYAVKFRNLNRVKLLLKHGSDPTMANDAGQTPFDLAKEMNELFILKLFLQHIMQHNNICSNVATRIYTNQSVSNQRNTDELYKAVIEGNFKHVITLMSRDKKHSFTNLSHSKNENIDEQDEKGNTALHVACSSNQEDEMCIALLSKYGTGSDIVNGLNLLKQTISENNLGCVKDLLKSGINVFTKNELGQTALHLAVLSNKESIVALILKHTENKQLLTKLINEKDNNGQTALHWAVIEEKRECVELLSKHGIDLLKTNDQRQSALHLAVQYNKLSMVEIILQQTENSDFINQVDQYGNTALHQACLWQDNENQGTSRENDSSSEYDIEYEQENYCRNISIGNESLQDQLECIRILFEHRINPAIVNNEGQTALHLAVKLNKASFLEVILQHTGTLNDLINHRDKNGKTALHYTLKEFGEEFRVNRGVYACVDILHRYGADFNIGDQKGETVLHYAVRDSEISNLKIVDRFLNYRIDTLKVNSYGETALHLAIKYYNFPACKNILKHTVELPSLLNKKDGRGKTVLHYAFYKLNTYYPCKNFLTPNHFFEALLALGANPDIRDLECKTALHMALAWSSDKVQLLLDYGANPALTDRDGRTSLHLALRRKSFIVKEILRRDKTLINQTDNYGNTALHHACKWPFSRLEILNILLREGADPNARNQLGETSLHLAVKEKNLDALKFLPLYSEVNPCIADNNGQTALHIAVSLEETKLVKLFLESFPEPGKFINLENAKGKTALQEALTIGRQDIVDVLKKYGAIY
ncbi:uncharacterized protein LOC129746031 [Uranotaenia lowii]|uniref:uncharacterized protein LOC129746031 n=1 Tax=Uranotaenia lowii TaxID=190385 RepID=UPI0024783515|nr:uncharacterized protein LOC129746031 [Uranotaenia lowii]